MKRGENIERELERLRDRKKTMLSAFGRTLTAYQEQSSIQVARIVADTHKLAAIISQISTLEGTPPE